MLRAWLISFVLLTALGTPALADEARLESGHLVRWEAGLDEAAQRVMAALPGIRSDVEDRIGFPLSGGPVELVLVRGHSAMRREASEGVPDWAAGVFVADRSRIVLRIDHLTPETAQRSIQTTLRHEWVHLSWSRRAGERTRRLPLWFEEGLAEEVGGGVSVDAGSALDIAAAFDHLIEFDEIRDSWPRDARVAGLAYRQARSFVLFFVEERGWLDLQRILDRLAAGVGEVGPPGSGGPFELLVHEQTGIPLDQWIARWRSKVERESRPWFHLLGRDLGWTLLMIGALISVGAFFVVRRRRRRAINALADA